MADYPQSINSQEQPLTTPEAEQQIWKAVDELEALINKFNNTPSRKDTARRADLASHLMSLLAEKYGIVPPREESTDSK